MLTVSIDPTYVALWFWLTLFCAISASAVQRLYRTDTIGRIRKEDLIGVYCVALVALWLAYGVGRYSGSEYHPFCK